MIDRMIKIFGNVRFCFRSGSLKEWNEENPILLEGEFGVVTGLEEVGDKLENKYEKVKIGDGIHTWSELDWWYGTLPIEEIVENVIAQTSKISTVTLPSSGWQGEASPYYQVVNIEGATENSKIDINPTLEQLNIFREKDITFVTANNKGTITVYCIGQKPANDYTIQVSITEVKMV